jgi:tRNA (guanine-N7-)-methyltransferase
MMNSLSLNVMTLDWPPDWSVLFGRDAPLTVEVGFGNGKFLAGLAQALPDQNLIGIERAHTPMSWTENLMLRQGLQNVRLVFGEAQPAVTCLLRPESVQTFHVNFSDPWHKKRHRRRRLLDESFLRLLASRLVPGGDLFIATDIAQYAGEIGIALDATPGLRNAYPTPWMTHREDSSVITHYEKKAQAAGRACHYFKWRRTDAPVDHPPVYEEILPMPNARLNLSLDIDAIGAAFAPVLARQDDRVAHIKWVYRQVGEPTLLFEAHLEEPLFHQNVMIQLSEQQDGAFVLQLSQIGHPRATHAVHDAIGAMVGWLKELDPSAEVIEAAYRVG